MSGQSPLGNNSSFSILQDDSSSSGPFEGPEKLLELWFSSSSSNLPNSTNVGIRQSSSEISDGGLGPSGKNLDGLRKVHRSVWCEMLDEVKCKVLSVIESEDMDAYLLSESSMFVWPHKIILKTCGTTTLLLGLPTLIKIAKTICGFSGVWRCFYSRKTFMFPERQLGPHKDWGQEVRFLDGLFENGSAYTVGKMNGDHWLLYLTPPRADVLISSPSSSNLPGTPNPTPVSERMPQFKVPDLIRYPTEPDSTLEILMTGLSPKACAQFYVSNSVVLTRYPEKPSIEGHAPGLTLAEVLGLSAESLIGGGQTDAFLFLPCGFSANMIGGVDNNRYATIHVTPEEAYSYASFECNVDYSIKQDELVAVVDRVLRVFEPNRMSITLFVSHDSQGRLVLGNTGSQTQESFGKVLGQDLAPNYHRTDQILYEFDGYDLVFVTFERL